MARAAACATEGLSQSAQLWLSTSELQTQHRLVATRACAQACCVNHQSAPCNRVQLLWRADAAGATQNQPLVDELWGHQARLARKIPDSNSVSRLRTLRNRHLLQPALFDNIGTLQCCDLARLKRGGYIANAALNHRNLRKRARDLPQNGRRHV